MPEIAEVETVRNTLKKLILNKKNLMSIMINIMLELGLDENNIIRYLR